METRTYQGHTYQRSGPGQPWTLAGPTLPRGGQIVSDPYAAKDEARKDDDQVIQRARLANEQARLAADQAKDPIQQRILLAQATEAEAKARDATQASISVDPALDKLTGSDYLSRLPAETQAQVQALSSGRMAFPSGAALKSPYWQTMLQHVAHFDPNFDAVNYNSRAATRRDFVSGKSAQNIRALNTAIGHLDQLDKQIPGTASHGGLPGATLLNQIENSVARSAGSSGITSFEQTASAVASELTQVFRGSGGAEADIKREIEHLSPNASLEQKKASVKNIASLLKSRLDALGDQYAQGMGTTAQPLHLLNSHADAAYKSLSKIDPTLGDASGGGDGGGGGSGGSGGPGGPIAGGSTKLARDPEREKALDALLRSGASNEVISATSRALGGQNIDPARLDQMRDAVKRGYRGSTFDTSAEVPTTAWNRIAGSPAGTTALAAIDASMGGTSDEIAGLMQSAVNGKPIGDNISALDAAKQATFRDNPNSAMVGQFGGSIAGLLGVGKLAEGLPLIRGLANPALASDVAAGAVSGAGQNNNSRLLGAAGGAVGSAAGNVAGALIAKPIGALARTDTGVKAVNLARDLVGRLPGIEPRLPITGVAAPTAAERAILTTAERAGIPKVTSSLADAQAQNIPMSLADTASSLTELGGAATRRSPVARDFAEKVLSTRNRGQIERMGGAVERELGPIGNTLQISDDLTKQARANAAPLYEQAYATPVPGTPEIASLLSTPFGKQALSRARTIAANERRAPDELGFALDEAGEPVLNPQPNDLIARHLAARSELDDAQAAYKAARGQPGTMDAARARVEQARQSMRDAEGALGAAPDPTAVASVPSYTTQTLDYVKRGMDNVLEQHRNPITNRLVLDEAGKAENAVKNQFLSEIDSLNDPFRQARRAYQGPVESRDALARGQDFYGSQIDANQIGASVADQTPEHLAQMQLGYRDAMMGKANDLRYSTNPWQILNSPGAEAKLSAMYPDTPGVGNLLSNRDAEIQMASTANRMIGGSPTAPRMIADQQFLPGAGASAAIDAATAVTGGVPVASIARILASSKLGDTLRLGIGKKAEQKAEDLIPMLLNTDPGASQAILQDLIEKAAKRSAFERAMTPTRAGSLFGSASAMTANDAFAR